MMTVRIGKRPSKMFILLKILTYLGVCEALQMETSRQRQVDQIRSTATKCNIEIYTVANEEYVAVLSTNFDN